MVINMRERERVDDSGDSAEKALVEYIHRETKIEEKVIKAVLEAERRYFLKELVG